MYYRYYVLGIILALLDLDSDFLIIIECFKRFSNTKVPNKRVGSIRMLFFNFRKPSKNNPLVFKSLSCSCVWPLCHTLLINLLCFPLCRRAPVRCLRDWHSFQQFGKRRSKAAAKLVVVLLNASIPILYYYALVGNIQSD